MANYSLQMPWGPAAGLEAAQQFGMQQEKHGLEQEQLRLMNEQRGLESDRYRGMTPHELDIKGWEAAGARAKMPYASDYALGQQGQWREQAAKGKVAEASADADIMANTVKGLEAAAVHLESQMAISPMLGQSEWQRLHQSMPPQIRQHFPSMYTPEIPGQIREMSKSLMNSAPHRREMAKQGEINTTQQGIASGHDATQLEIARINAKSREDMAELRAKMTQARENFQQYLTNWARKEVTEGRMTIEQAAKAVEQMMINSKMAGAPEDPRALPREVLGNQPINPTPQPRVPPPSAIPPGPQVPQQSRPQPGQPLSQQQVQQMGGLFDPRYDYAVGPDGKLKRKLKQ